MQELWDMLEAIIDYKRKHGYAPSMRELCDLCGLSSTSAVHARILEMEARGMIERTPMSARSVIVTNEGLWNLRQMQSRPWQARGRNW